MKEFKTIGFDVAQCRKEIDELGALLDSKDELSERVELLPFFRSREQLTAFIGARFAEIGPANRIAYEFDVNGDYVADIVIGNFERKAFCAIELEDAGIHSVFRAAANRARPYWGERLEHGFGQLIDWFYSFDDTRKTELFTRNFGYGHIKFFRMLTVGRKKYIAEQDQNRLRWRFDRVTINTHKVHCATYDELFESLDDDWRMQQIFALGKSPIR